MNKNRFISELSRRLKGIPKQDYDDAMNYYIEYLMDSGVDDTTDVIPMLGTPEEVAARILDEYAEKQYKKASKEGGVKNSSKAIWYIILGLFAAPIAFPIALTIAVVLFTVLIVIGSIIVALLASSIGIVIAGICAIPSIFMAGSLAQSIVILGISLVAISFGSLMCILVYKIGHLVIKAMIAIFGGITKMKKSKESRGKRSMGDV
ncbi:MAG: DUF1700 domain-containing protein [Eubacterium sp.]|nr:DUF1700 domain-containing protein [Eubacterium sp.]